MAGMILTIGIPDAIGQEGPGANADLRPGAIEFHGWQSRVKDIDKPDQIIFDLDPGEGVPFEAVKLGAQDVRNYLKSLGLTCFPRLTGGKGIHLVVPLKPRHEWDDIKAFTRSVAKDMEKKAPDAYIATMSKQKREGKIFIDYLRNDFSATAIAPFSLRSRKNAPIAVPITWRELKSVNSLPAFTFKNIGERMNKRTEKMISEFLTLKQRLSI